MNTEFQDLPNVVSPKEVQTYFGISRSTTSLTSIRPKKQKFFQSRRKSCPDRSGNSPVNSLPRKPGRVRLSMQKQTLLI